MFASYRVTTAWIRLRRTGSDVAEIFSPKGHETMEHRCERCRDKKVASRCLERRCRPRPDHSRRSGTRKRLMFVREVHEQSEREVGNKDWALFLCTDTTLSMSTSDARGLRPSVVASRYTSRSCRSSYLQNPRRVDADLRIAYRLHASVCKGGHLMLMHEPEDEGEEEVYEEVMPETGNGHSLRGRAESDELCPETGANLPRSIISATLR